MERKGTDWDHWRKMDELDIHDAINLLLKIDPESWLAGRIRVRSLGYEASNGQREIYKQAVKLWDLAWASYHQGRLRMDSGMAGTSVAMADWLRWAESKQLPIPPELADLVPTAQAPSAAPSTTDPPLGTRERTTLLILIGAMARALELDVKAPSKTAGILAAMTEELGSPVSKRAIENHLNAIEDAISRKQV